MKLSWRLLLALAVLGAVLAEEEDVPDVGVDGEEEDDDHLSLDEEESRNLRPRAYSQSAFNNAVPSGFRPTPSLAELAGYQRPQEQSHHRLQEQPQHRPQEQIYQRPQEQTYRPQQEQQESYVNLQPSRAPQQQLYEEQRAPARTPHRKHQEQRPTKHQLQADEELEEEKEEPDRLTLLLQQSKFQCTNKQSGYYADEELNCEVFHYCQDSVKHSWVCPDGFSFHQVHLICMPPTHDNICQKSSKYHFVNEYLYRPINEAEVQKKPNVSLRYSDRYYPSEVYTDDRYDNEDEDEDLPERKTVAPPQRPTHQQQQFQHQHQQQLQQHPQVFRSAEEVNIPLVQRRPQQRPYNFEF